MGVPTFVVGTGRCGSTMLSNMLREHPHVLSLSEFFAFVTDFGTRIPETFSRESMDGQRFWSFVAATTPFVNFGLRHRVRVPESLYPCDAPTARFSRTKGVPAILHTTLPHLGDGHELLFEELEEEVKKWPAATLGDHYEHLFGWLARHFDKRLWIERSGGALAMAEQILVTFPDARLIHIVRDGRDAAMSMHEHLGFQLFFAMSSLGQHLGVDPLHSADRTHIDRVPVELRPFLPENFDLDAFCAFRVPLPLCGAFWTQAMSAGLQVLCTLPADRLLTLRYEDFFVDPRRQLDALAAFLGEEFIDDTWSARCAATVRKPRSSWRDLPEETARALTAACEPGFRQLRAAGVHYEA